MIFDLMEEREIVVLPINDDIEDWRKVMTIYRLLPNDAMIVSTCFLHEIKEIATFDNDLTRVEPLEIIQA